MRDVSLLVAISVIQGLWEILGIVEGAKENDGLDKTLAASRAVGSPASG